MRVGSGFGQSQSNLQAYFPSGEVWYDLRSLTKVEIESIPNFVTLDAAPGYGPGLLVKGGAILPTQTPGIAKTTLQRCDFLKNHIMTFFYNINLLKLCLKCEHHFNLWGR